MQIVGGTVLSQTSQALEAMTLVVLLYAAINLESPDDRLANRRLCARGPLTFAVDGGAGTGDFERSRDVADKPWPSDMTSHFVRRTLIEPRIPPSQTIAMPAVLRGALSDRRDGRVSPCLLALLACSAGASCMGAPARALARQLQRSVPGRRRRLLGLRRRALEAVAGRRLSAGPAVARMDLLRGFALFWTWVVRRSHAASMQRVLLGFIAAAGRLLRCC